MNRVLRPYLDRFAAVYLDDIVVYSRTFEEHLVHLRKVLSMLRQHKLFAKWSKCLLGAEEMEYLGHIVSAAGVAPDPAKVAAVRDWPEPSSVHDV